MNSLCKTGSILILNAELLGIVYPTWLHLCSQNNISFRNELHIKSAHWHRKTADIGILNGLRFKPNFMDSDDVKDFATEIAGYANCFYEPNFA